MISPHHSHPACRYIERNVPLGISRAPMSIVTRPGRLACLYWTWSPGPFRATIQPSCLSLAVTSRVLFECSALPMSVHRPDVYGIHTTDGSINTQNVYQCVSIF